ncbi:MAG: hypothetical protein RL722_2833 [Pseudomonadota bacterium]|jgi:methylated-DNA-[protein]-cysteine S-methyltransferase
MLNTLATDCDAQTTVASPLGPILLVATPRGLAGLWFEGQKYHPGALDPPERPAHPALQAGTRWLANYFKAGDDGTRPALDLGGTPFQRLVWTGLLDIRAGQTATYGGLAARIGRAAAVRAVAAAVGRNPVSLIVPCHRIIGQDGSLTGYAGGLERKAALLALEAQAASSTYTLTAQACPA